MHDVGGDLQQRHPGGVGELTQMPGGLGGAALTPLDQDAGGDGDQHTRVRRLPRGPHVVTQVLDREGQRLDALTVVAHGLSQRCMQVIRASMSTGLVM